MTKENNIISKAIDFMIWWAIFPILYKEYKRLNKK